MGCGATTGVISTGESAGQVPDQMDARFQLIGWVHICFVSSPALLYLLFGIMITHDSLKKTVKKKTHIHGSGLFRGFKTINQVSFTVPYPQSNMAGGKVLVCRCLNK